MSGEAASQIRRGVRCRTCGHWVVYGNQVVRMGHHNRIPPDGQPYEVVMPAGGVKVVARCCHEHPDEPHRFCGTLTDVTGSAARPRTRVPRK